MQKLAFSNGDSLDAIGLGTWKSSPGEVKNAVLEALKIGYRHLDCAAIYGNEAEIGEALQIAFKKGIVERSDLWITSKLWNTAHRKEQVEPALKKTLQDLQVGYLDLYLIHWPIVMKEGVSGPPKAEDFLSLEEVPILETWQALEECASLGMVRHLGLSNFSVKKIKALLPHARIKPEMNQVESHPLLAQNDLIKYCLSQKIHLTAYSPLGSLDRSEQMKKANEPNLLENPTIQAISKKHNCSPAQVLIRWAEKRGTAVIPKSVNPQRLAENLASTEVPLDNKDMEAIHKLDQHYRIIDGSFWVKEGNPYTLENLWDE